MLVLLESPAQKGQLESDRWIMVAWCLMLFSEITNGPFRFYAESVGLAMMVYFPKAVATLLVVAWAALNISQGAVFFSLAMIFVAAVVAVENSLPLPQIGFGFWVFQYLLVGVPLWSTIGRHQIYFIKSCLIGWAIAVVGVIINSQINFPWVGFEYSIGGVDIEGSREWSTFDIDRLAGFGRASIASASQILALSLVLFPVCYKKSKIGAVFLAALSAYAIYLTTAKSVAGAYIFSILIFLMTRLPALAFFSSFTACLVAILLPFSTLYVSYRLAITSWWAQILFLSFDERLTLTWPLSIDLILKQGSLIFGRGLGGVGSPQKIFSVAGPSMYDLSFTDSFGLFLYGTFGIVGVLMLVVFALKVCRSIGADSGLMNCVALAALGCMLAGGAIDIVEAGVPAIIIGMAIGVFLYGEVDMGRCDLTTPKFRG